LATVTAVEPVPVAPLASRTPTAGVRAPLSAAVVAQGIDTGPLLVVVVVPSVRPPSVSVYVFDPAAAFSIQIVNQTVPLTVLPVRGWVMKTLIDPGGGGGGVVFVTLTGRVAVAVRPAPSRTVRLRVWLPSPTVVVFQLNDALAADPDVAKTCVPSTVRVNAIGVPFAPVADMSTLTEPLTAAPLVGLVNEAARVGVPPLDTVTDRVATPTLPAESRTVAVTVCAPSGTLRVSHAREIGPEDVSFVVATVPPPTLNE
jgi:hypothetical protein